MMDPVTRYEVGQILFVLPNKKTAVVPIQVVEEITKKTIQGDSVSYIVRYSKDPEKKIDINDVDGEVYESSDHVRRTLIERSANALNRLVAESVEKARLWYDGAFEATDHDDDDSISLGVGTVQDNKTRDGKGRFMPVEPEQSGTAATVTLEDGSVAKVILPPELQG